MIWKLLGVIFASMGLAFIISMLCGWAFDPTGEKENFTHWYIVLAITFGLAAIAFILGRNANDLMFRKEGLTVIGLGWILTSIVGALPYILLLPHCSFADAFFESASGLTTTGASVFSDFSDFPKSLIFWRCMSQWIGGLGVVVFFVAILSFIGAGAKILYSNESSGQSAEINSSRIQRGVLEILLLYLVLSVACAAIYHALGMDWLESICYMFATLSTGGFSAGDVSLTSYNSPLLEWVVILFMIIGGTSFLIMLRLIKGDKTALKESQEITVFYTIIFITSLIVFLELLDAVDIGVEQALRTSVFQVVSIITTTGFATADFDRWVVASKIILLIIMVTGGSSGSTAGGCKIIRFMVAFKVCLRQIEKSFRARVVRPIYINNRCLESEAYEAVMVFLVLIGIATFVSCFIVAFIEPYISPMGVISSVFACIFNIGPGLAEVGPTQNFAFFLPLTKIYLAILMILGRLELYAVLVLFAPSLWKKFS